eukprot:2748593-Pyramimonas_sp.AAC.1
MPDLSDTRSMGTAGGGHAPSESSLTHATFHNRDVGPCEANNNLIGALGEAMTLVKPLEYAP